MIFEYPDAQIEKNSLTVLKNILDKEKYYEFKIFNIIKRNKNIHWKYGDFKRNCSHPLLRLFLLNESVETSEINSFISKRVFEKLNKINILRVSNNKIFSNFTIFAHDKKYILSDNFWIKERFDEYVFTGETSFLLLNELKDFLYSHKRLLDLGCGAGFFLLVLSDMYKTGIGIDINKRAIKLTRLNIFLNNISGTKIKLKIGNLNNYFKPNSFDFIIANFPFAPIPSMINYPIYANGGETGFEPLKEGFNSIYNSLKRNSFFAFLTASIGSKNESLLVSSFKNLAGGKAMSVILNEIVKTQLEKCIFCDQILSKNSKAIIMNFYKNRGYTHLYLYFGLLKKKNKGWDLEVKTKGKLAAVLDLLCNIYKM